MAPALKTRRFIDEALVRDGKTKAQAAAISNAALKKGYKKGRHRSRKGKRK